MKPAATQRNPGSRSNPRRYAYSKVTDNRKHPIRGLWKRNGRFYARLTVEDDCGQRTIKWVALSGNTAAQAQEDLRRLLVERSEDRLRPLGLTPKLGDYITQAYRPQLQVSGKRLSSVEKELGYLRKWAEKLGQIRLNKIRPAHLSRFLTDLAQAGYAGRSVNLHLIAIRGALKAACRDGHLKPPLPFEGLQWQKVDQKSRALFTPAEIDLLCDVGLQATKNGRLFVDYLRFLQFSGARRNEALRVAWDHVDFENCQVTIGFEGDAKSRKPRAVDFNPSLEGHLKEMWERRRPDSRWLFPTPRRGGSDIPARTFMESLRLARSASGVLCGDCGKVTVGQDMLTCPKCKSRNLEHRRTLLPGKLVTFCFHDLRHHFTSYAVMAGADITSVSEWLGHSDCLLVARIYGHLAAEHKKRQAAKVRFAPFVLPEQGKWGTA